jgi:gamma-glutamyltranspeptidase
VVDPKNSSLGGHGFAAVYVAKTREVRALNFYGTAPAAATPERLRLAISDRNRYVADPEFVSVLTGSPFSITRSISSTKASTSPRVV